MALQAAALLLLVVSLTGPEWVRRSAEFHKPAILILRDRSGSFQGGAYLGLEGAYRPGRAGHRGTLPGTGLRRAGVGFPRAGLAGFGLPGRSGAPARAGRRGSVDRAARRTSPDQPRRGRRLRGFGGRAQPPGRVPVLRRPRQPGFREGLAQLAGAGVPGGVPGDGDLGGAAGAGGLERAGRHRRRGGRRPRGFLAQRRRLAGRPRLPHPPGRQGRPFRSAGRRRGRSGAGVAAGEDLRHSRIPWKPGPGAGRAGWRLVLQPGGGAGNPDPYNDTLPISASRAARGGRRIAVVKPLRSLDEKGMADFLHGWTDAAVSMVAPGGPARQARGPGDQVWVEAGMLASRPALLKALREGPAKVVVYGRPGSLPGELAGIPVRPLGFSPGAEVRPARAAADVFPDAVVRLKVRGFRRPVGPGRPGSLAGGRRALRRRPSRPAHGLVPARSRQGRPVPRPASHVGACSSIPRPISPSARTWTACCAPPPGWPRGRRAP